MVWALLLLLISLLLLLLLLLLLYVARTEEGRSDFKILTANPTGKRSMGRPRRRWEDNIRMDLKNDYSNQK